MPPDTPKAALGWFPDGCEGADDQFSTGLATNSNAASNGNAHWQPAQATFHSSPSPASPVPEAPKGLSPQDVASIDSFTPQDLWQKAWSFTCDESFGNSNSSESEIFNAARTTWYSWLKYQEEIKKHHAVLTVGAVLPPQAVTTVTPVRQQAPTQLGRPGPAKLPELLEGNWLADPTEDSMASSLQSAWSRQYDLTCLPECVVPGFHGKWGIALWCRSCGSYVAWLKRSNHSGEMEASPDGGCPHFFGPNYYVAGDGGIDDLNGSAASTIQRSSAQHSVERQPLPLMDSSPSTSPGKKSSFPPARSGMGPAAPSSVTYQAWNGKETSSSGNAWSNYVAQERNASPNQATNHQGWPGVPPKAIPAGYPQEPKAAPQSAASWLDPPGLLKGRDDSHGADDDDISGSRPPWQIPNNAGFAPASQRAPLPKRTPPIETSTAAQAPNGWSQAMLGQGLPSQTFPPKAPPKGPPPSKVASAPGPPGLGPAAKSTPSQVDLTELMAFMQQSNAGDQASGPPPVPPVGQPPTGQVIPPPPPKAKAMPGFSSSSHAATNGSSGAVGNGMRMQAEDFHQQLRPGTVWADTTNRHHANDGWLPVHGARAGVSIQDTEAQVFRVLPELVETPGVLELPPELRVTPEQLRSEDGTLVCVVCTQVVHKPVVTRCTHLFCYDCMKAWVTANVKSKQVNGSNGKHAVTCPTCNFELFENDITCLCEDSTAAHGLLWRLYQDQVIRCAYHHEIGEGSCHWVGKFKDYAHHVLLECESRKEAFIRNDGILQI
eukprot:gnl/MRDRNA2_/MRDRNA2_17839_c0_seq1.p1 gnl/MRDRNA2_/MRDRNA2_17839_c0~~gnl/MRDRNA2_/MRDRNA2_17839_c0_seq1.p1  ORF type:complete len:847 (+),score=161.34 gnl/MRDRNA2_/MRDRNA2_17839_c0_seq1:221-2542(+)